MSCLAWCRSDSLVLHSALTSISSSDSPIDLISSHCFTSLHIKSQNGEISMASIFKQYRESKMYANLLVQATSTPTHLSSSAVLGDMISQGDAKVNSTQWRSLWMILVLITMYGKYWKWCHPTPIKRANDCMSAWPWSNNYVFCVGYYLLGRYRWWYVASRIRAKR